MKKQLTNKTVYEPNQSVKITVNNKPIYDDVGTFVGYKVDVTLKHSLQRLDELKFSSDDDVSEFMNNISYDDPQQALPGLNN